VNRNPLKVTIAIFKRLCAEGIKKEDRSKIFPKTFSNPIVTNALKISNRVVSVNAYAFALC